MTAEKITGYTLEQTAELVAGYKAGKTPQELGAAIGKTARSVIAKLSREGVYVSKAKEAGGKREMLKSEMVTEISKLVGKDEEILESLEKATGVALLAVLTALRATAETE